MIKQYFTDGLVQLAIILSLLRTDLNNFVNHGNLIQYPEVQEMLYGQTAVYLPTNIHNQFYSSNSFVHPKNLDIEYNSALFQGVQNLLTFRHIEDTDISAFLVDSSSSLPISVEETNSHIINNQTLDNTNSSTVSDQDNSSNDSNQHEDGAIAALSDFSSEPSNEDLDLIDVLWRQDIDLGVGKDVYDVKLRRELERERELELQKKREKHKELDLLRKKLQEEQKNYEQQWLADNFTQDGETGEWVPLQQGGNTQVPQNIAITEVLNQSQLTHLDENLSLQEALDFLNTEVGNFSIPENASSTNATIPPSDVPLSPPFQNQDYLNSSPPHQLTSSPNDLGVATDNYVNNTSSSFFCDQMCALQPNQQPQPFSPNLDCQESFEDRWQDLVSLLDLPTPNPPSAPISNSSMSTVDTSLPENFSPNNVVIQNATLPVLLAENNQTVVSLNNSVEDELISPVHDYNASVTQTGSITDLDWNTDDVFISNLSTVIQDRDIQDVDDLLLADGDLDLSLTEGLEAIQMLSDSVNDDSVLSLGETSSLKDVQESCSMSPYDGVEGATGGSDYDSPPYSKTSKYDGDEYHYSFNSYGYSRSESSPSNYSTSSNDTEFSKPNGGSNHVNHNHTYNTPPGMQPKEIKKYIKTDKPRHKGPAPKDAKRAAELKVPFTVEQITDSPVEEFNEMLSKYKLNDAQLQLVRDIRRRGKNKIAAQNCRKRKMDQVLTVEEELNQLKRTRDKLISERQMIDQQTREMKARFSHMYQEIFNSLRDDNGHPYDPNEYSLQQSSDGDVFLIPRNMSVSSDDNKNRKRKNNRK